MRCTSCIVILTECCLVTGTVKVISTDPYINEKIIHSLFPSLCIGENHGTVLEFLLKYFTKPHIFLPNQLYQGSVSFVHNYNYHVVYSWCMN